MLVYLKQQLHTSRNRKFENFRKRLLSLVMCVCPSIRMEQLTAHETYEYFHEI